MTEILKLINNTTEIDLLNPLSSDGVALISWSPALAPWKEIASSPFLGDGSNLLIRNFEDIIETMQFAIVGSSQDEVTTRLQNFVGLLELGVAYEMGNYDYPTYLKVKPDSTTNTSYGRVKKYKLDELPQVMGASPFNTGALANGYTMSSAIAFITIAFQVPWYQDVAPSSSTVALVGGYGSSRGTVDDLGNPEGQALSYVAPKANTAQITHGFRFDSSAGTYSADFVGGAAFSAPHDIFPSPIGNGDIVYLGSQTGAAELTGVFSNVVFEIGTAGTASMTVSWEYWNGSGWGSLSNVSDETLGFGFVTGSRIVRFDQPSDWATTNPGMGVTAYWVRGRITALNGNSTVPTQVNKHVHTVNWPFVEFGLSETTPGDIPAYIKFRFRNYEGGTISRVVAGLKTVPSFQQDFKAYLNCSIDTVQNPAGITVTSDFTDAVSTLYPVGRAVSISALTATGSPAVDKSGPCAFEINNTYVKGYRGKYRMFLGIEVISISGTPAVGDLKFFVDVFPTGFANIPYFVSETKPLNTTTTNIVQCLDFGEVEIVPTVRNGDVNYNDVTVRIRHVLVTGKTYSYRAVFLALIPSDEHLIDVSFLRNDTPVFEDGYYVFDGTSGQRTDSYVLSFPTQYLFTHVVPRTPKLPFIQKGATQRYWFLTLVENKQICEPGVVLGVEAWYVARYLTCLRGAN